jgi:hypothetical protein
MCQILKKVVPVFLIALRIVSASAVPSTSTNCFSKLMFTVVTPEIDSYISRRMMTTNQGFF